MKIPDSNSTGWSLRFCSLLPVLALLVVLPAFSGPLLAQSETDQVTVPKRLILHGGIGWGKSGPDGDFDDEDAGPAFFAGVSTAGPAHLYFRVAGVDGFWDNSGTARDVALMAGYRLSRGRATLSFAAGPSYLWYTLRDTDQKFNGAGFGVQVDLATTPQSGLRIGAAALGSWGGDAHQMALALTLALPVL